MGMVDTQDTQLVNVEVAMVVETSFGNNYFDVGDVEILVDKLEIEVVQLLVAVDIQSS